MNPSLMQKTFQLSFSSGHVAMAARVRRSADLTTMLQEIGLEFHRPALVLVGGASGITEDSFTKLRSLFETVLAPLMEQLGVTVVDGGTDSGVMKLMGEAYHHISGSFPLVGVAAAGTVIFPDDDTAPSDDKALLEPHHSHFVLVPGALWGDEAPWIARVASTLSANAPSVTVLVNGGRIAWQDVSSSVRAGRPVVVIAGSGRTADELAAAIRGEVISDRAHELVNSGLLQAVDLDTSSQELTRALTQILSVSK
jgi:hypothetical protein